MFDFLHDIGSHEESYSIRISPLLTWPTAVAGEADSVSSVSASACHIYRPNSLNPGQGLVKNIVGYKDVIFALHGWPRIASKPSRLKN